MLPVRRWTCASDEIARAASAVVTGLERDARTPPSAARSPRRSSRAGSSGRRGCSSARRRAPGRRAPRTRRAPSRRSVRASTQWPSRSATSEAWKYAAPIVRGSFASSASWSARSMSSRAASKSRWRRQQRERQERMFERSWSRRQARALRERERLVEEADRRLDAVQLVPADAEGEEHVRPLDVGEAVALGDARAPRAGARARGGCAPRRICARPAPTRARTCELGQPVARRRRDERRRTRRPPPRRGSPRSAPRPGRVRPRAGRARRSRHRSRGIRGRRRAARQATRSSRGSGASCRARSGETYSLENRSPASSLCVSPAATRSWRRRSPRRSPVSTAGRCRAEGGVFVVIAAGAAEVNLTLHQTARARSAAIPLKGHVHGKIRVNQRMSEIT